MYREFPIFSRTPNRVAMANDTKPIKHWRIGPLPAYHAAHASHQTRPTKPADQMTRHRHAAYVLEVDGERLNLIHRGLEVDGERRLAAAVLLCARARRLGYRLPAATLLQFNLQRVASPRFRRSAPRCRRPPPGLAPRSCLSLLFCVAVVLVVHRLSAIGSVCSSAESDRRPCRY